jgi:hypothetical protein
MYDEPITFIDHNMSRNQVADTLAQLIFSDTKDWQRTITIDSDTRDLLVKALRYLAV